MTETIRFVDGISYTEGDMATFNRRMRPEGVLADSPLGVLGVTSIGGFGMRVSVGDVMIQGFLYTNDANKDLTHGGNASGSTRIDTIIIRVSPTANTATAVILVGTPGAGAPTLTQSPGGTWEYPLYNVTVANGAGSLSGANLTDRRTYSQWPVSALDPAVALDTDVTATNARVTTLESKPQLMAWGRIDNNVLVVASSGGVASAAHPATGIYQINLSSAIATGKVLAFATPFRGALGQAGYIAYGDQISTTQVQFNGHNAAGSDFNIDFHFAIYAAP